MASEEQCRYVLCVVDLRGCSECELDAEWSAERVEPLARIVPNIGGKVEETCLFVAAAKSSPVAISNELALRYGVPVSVWEAGISIKDWVAKICED